MPTGDLPFATQLAPLDVGAGAQPLEGLFGVAILGRGLDVLERLQRMLGRLHRVTVRLLQLRKDFFAVHVNRTWRLDTEAHLVPAYFEHRHDDFVPDHDALIRTSREHEHEILPSMAAACSAPERELRHIRWVVTRHPSSGFAASGR